MNAHILPECYFDTVLVKTVLGLNIKDRLNHKKGCTNVVRGITETRLNDDFALGIIDKDKKEIDYLKDSCTREIVTNNLILWKHRTKQHYFIQIVPALESWILAVAEETKINIEDFGLSKNLEKLKKKTKSELVEENEQLRNLCKQLVDGGSNTISTLSTWITYLYKNNRDADINKLKGDV